MIEGHGQILATKYLIMCFYTKVHTFKGAKDWRQSCTRIGEGVITLVLLDVLKWRKLEVTPPSFPCPPKYWGALQEYFPYTKLLEQHIETHSISLFPYLIRSLITFFNYLVLTLTLNLIQKHQTQWHNQWKKNSHIPTR
jgi:hypothetical protein